MGEIQYYRPTKAIIDLRAIQKNITQLKKHLQPDVQIIAVIKANGYGHGDIAVAQAALQAGATILAVATPEEAVHVRSHIATADILVLGASPVSFVTYAAENNISLTVFSKEWVEQAALFHLTNKLKLHIKIDTGMGRIGVTSIQKLQLLQEAIVAAGQMEIDGVFTHFATADEENTGHFEQQVELFHDMLKVLAVKPRIIHVANTATVLVKDKSLQYDAIRFGISMYGLAPSHYVAKYLPFPLKPALSLETELVHVKELAAGQTVGYGATYTAEEDVFIGTLPIGYADGLLRKLTGQTVLIDGQRAPIVGRICMDQCMILLPKAYTVGEKVTLIGTQQNVTISLDEWANKLETINYEIPCIITNRVPRIYTS
ncbi:alanine racemase [Metasolibacillus fluoroglycofenilyticus]|uniref:alanine racemase n=1 Tax=Metasolibacillus fluoroglycofenilyticus TaxID=1239396 RepID=UPI000D350B0A|nr:alanine racemase [Metasolibacillus fluoroglycofenilyticus]